MRLVALSPIVIAAGLVVGARALGAEANRVRATWPAVVDEPYAPSPEAAPVVTLGYREIAADLLWIRALGYFGGDHATSAGVRNLVAAIVALDPRFEEAYAWSSIAMQSITMRLGYRDYFGALRILERGMQEFPDNYRMPLRAGEIYARSLQVDDPEQASFAIRMLNRIFWRRVWKAEGTRLLSRAVRLPGAPKSLGTYVAHLESELGQRDKAIRDLRELIMYTSSPYDRDKLVKKLAKLTAGSSDAIAYELEIERARFLEAWRRDRPELPPSMYVIVGPPLPAWFDPADLAAEPAPMVLPIEPLPALADDAGELAPTR